MHWLLLYQVLAQGCSFNLGAGDRLLQAEQMQFEREPTAA